MPGTDLRLSRRWTTTRRVTGTFLCASDLAQPVNLQSIGPLADAGHRAVMSMPKVTPAGRALSSLEHMSEHDDRMGPHSNSGEVSNISPG